MPYVEKGVRAMLDPAIDSLHQSIVNLKLDDEMTNVEACTSYVFSRLLLMVYGDRDTVTDSDITDALGVLSCVQSEYYRKVVTPHADQQEFDNGSIQVHTHEPEIVGTVEINAETIDKEALKKTIQRLNEIAAERGLFNQSDD